MMDVEPIRSRFGDIWPTHNHAFNELLVRLRECFDGDLDRMLILRYVGERDFTPNRGRGLSYDAFLEGERNDRIRKTTNIQSVAYCTRIPRETVRRKVQQLIDRGWLLRQARGELYVTPEAAEALQPMTAFTLEYLNAIGECILRISKR
jgi:hypothetical protein